MKTATSRLTKKYQATIPEPVRRVLHLEAGDAIAFDIEGDDIHLRKARSEDLAFTQSLEGTLNEWVSEADEEAYRVLPAELQNPPEDDVRTPLGAIRRPGSR